MAKSLWGNPTRSDNSNTSVTCNLTPHYYALYMWTCAKSEDEDQSAQVWSTMFVSCIDQRTVEYLRPSASTFLGLTEKAYLRILILANSYVKM